MNYLLPETVYKVLKWVGLVAAPAIAVLYGTLGNAWGWPATEEVVLTINAVGVCIGALIGVSQGTASPDGDNEKGVNTEIEVKNG